VKVVAQLLTGAAPADIGAGKVMRAARLVLQCALVHALMVERPVFEAIIVDLAFGLVPDSVARRGPAGCDGRVPIKPASHFGELFGWRKSARHTV